jgi:hypothetical protein
MHNKTRTHKKFVNEMNQNNVGFRYLKNKFSRIIDAIAGICWVSNKGVNTGLET